MYEKAINGLNATENQRNKSEIAGCNKERINIEEVVKTKKNCSC